jgi:hypothetical protein
MELSVKEISESLGVNRNKIYRAIKNLDLEPLSVDGISKYDYQAVEAIRAEIDRIETKKAPSKPNRTEQARETDRVDLVDALRETIRVQAETIDHLKSENIELREMIRREQDIRFGKLAIEASTKPKLTDRIKSLFSGRNKSQENEPKEITTEDE